MKDSVIREVLFAAAEDGWVRRALAGRDFNDWALATILTRWPSRLFRILADGRSRPIRRSIVLTTMQDEWITEALSLNHSMWTSAARDALISEAVGEVSRREARRL